MSLHNKPLPGTLLLADHPLNPLRQQSIVPGGLLLPLNEGSGRPRAFIGPQFYGAVPTSGGTERLTVITGTKWNPSPGAAPPTSKWGGAALATLATSDVVNLGANTDFLPLEHATIIIALRKRDTTFRTHRDLSVDTGTNTQMCNVTIGDTTQNVRFDFGGVTEGTNRLSVALTVADFGDDVWAFSVGPRGMDIWQNGRLLASQTGHSTRTGTVADMKIGVNSAQAANADLSDYAFVYIYPHQLTQDEIRYISMNPFCFYDWGEDQLVGAAAILPDGTLGLAGGFFKSVQIFQAGSLTSEGVLNLPVIRAQLAEGTLAPTGALASTEIRTRLYFDSSTDTPGVAPAFDAGWDATSQALRRRLNHVKGSSAILQGELISWADAAGTKALDRQYISRPLDGDQIIAGTAKMQLMVREWTSIDNVDQLYLVIKVVSIDGGTVRGTLLSINNYGPTGEFTNQSIGSPDPAVVYRNKTGADGDSVTSVNALSGDRILIEIGYSNSTAGTTPVASALWGEDADDAPEDETSLGTWPADGDDFIGWVEFSGTLLFTEPTQSIEVGGDLVLEGALVKQIQLLPIGTLALTGNNTNILTAIRSFAGTLTSSGAATALFIVLLEIAGTIASAGSVVFSFVRSMLAGGTITPTGNLLRGPGRIFGGTLTSSGALKRSPGLAVGGELPTTGSLTPVRLFNLAVSGTLGLAGVFIQTFSQVLAGTLGLAGNLIRGAQRTFAGVLGLSGRLNVAESTGATVACETTAGDLVTRVYERLDDSRVYYTEAEVLHALDMAQRLFCWLTLCLERIGSFSFTAGTTFYTGSNGVRTQLLDFWVPLRMSLQSAFSGARIFPETLDNLDKLDEEWQSTTGTPRRYVQMGYDFLAVYPQPASPLAAQMVYAAEPTQITALASPIEVPADQAPLLVDYALWLLRAKEGGQEFASTLEGLGRFVAGAKKYGAFVRAHSKAQLYDIQPPDLSLFDMSRFIFRPPRQESTRERKK